MLRALVVMYKLSDSHPGKLVDNPDEEEGGKILVLDSEVYRNGAYLTSRGHHLVMGDDDGDEVGIHEDSIETWHWVNQESLDAESARDKADGR